MTNPAPVSRQVSYFPAVDGRGKYHARNVVSDTAVCGSPVVLDASPMSAMVYGVDDERIHPFVCRRCVRIERAR